MDNKTAQQKLAASLGRDVKEISSLIDSFAAILREHLCDMDSVALPGFGEFKPVKEDEHVTTDPITGKQMLIPPTITVNFSPSSILKRKIKE